MRDLHDSDGRSVSSLVIINQLLGQRHSLIIGDVHEIIAQHDNERLVSYESLSLKDSISQSARMALTDEVQTNTSGFIDQFEQVVFTLFFEVVFQFKV